MCSISVARSAPLAPLLLGGTYWFSLCAAIRCGLSARLDAELAEDVVNMHAYCVDADTQAGSDFLVAGAVSNNAQNLQLTLAQR